MAPVAGQTNTATHILRDVPRQTGSTTENGPAKSTAVCENGGYGLVLSADSGAILWDIALPRWMVQSRQERMIPRQTREPWVTQ